MLEGGHFFQVYERSRHENFGGEAIGVCFRPGDVIGPRFDLLFRAWMGKFLLIWKDVVSDLMCKGKSASSVFSHLRA